MDKDPVEAVERYIYIYIHDIYYTPENFEKNKQACAVLEKMYLRQQIWRHFGYPCQFSGRHIKKLFRYDM